MELSGNFRWCYDQEYLTHMEPPMYRGKGVNDGRWIFGNHIFRHGEKCFLGEDPDALYPIRPKTLSLWSLNCDSDGRSIYTGDIIKMYRNEHKDYVPGMLAVMALVPYQEGRKIFCRVCKDRFYDPDGGDIIDAEYVIGNIWDNPELLIDPALIGED